MDSKNFPNSFAPAQQRISSHPSLHGIESSQKRYLDQLPRELREKIKNHQEIPILPAWPEQNRGVPNLCLRSALFGVIKRGRRQAVKGEWIASLKGVGIRYTGWKLDQGDFDVLAQALHLQRHHIERTPENYIRFEVKTFLRAIGRQAGKSGREWLKDCFRRLTATTIELNVNISNRWAKGEYTYAGSLVDEFFYNYQEQTYFLKINPKFADLFDAGWTQLQWQQRLHLKSGLAKWLHGFYSSHREPFPMKVITIKKLCGSDCKRMGDFRRCLRRAMDELTDAAAIQSWRIDKNDKLHVQRTTKKAADRRFPEGA